MNDTLQVAIATLTLPAIGLVAWGLVVFYRRRQCRHPVNDRLCAHLADRNYSYCFKCDKHFTDLPWICSMTGKPHNKSSRDLRQ